MSNTTMTFDNLRRDKYELPSPYEGFDFLPHNADVVGHYDTTQGYVTGFGAAAVSGVEAGYFANSFSVTEHDHKNFSAVSGYFTAGENNSDTLLITGFRNGVEVKAREFSISDTPTLLNLRGFQDVTRLTITSQSGSEDAFDNLTLHHHT